MKKALLSILFLCGITSSTVASDSSTWEYQFQVYATATNINGNASIGRIQGAPVDVGFDNILENLKMAAMVHFEAMDNQDKWGFIVDYGFMNLGKKNSTPQGGILTGNLRQGVLEAMVFNRYTTETFTYDLYTGIRWWDNNIEFTLDSTILPGSPNLRGAQNWVDLVVGGRIFVPINSKWDFIGSLDIAGIGSDFSVSTSAGFQYEISDNWSLDLKYRALWVDYSTGTAGAPGSFKYDTVTHGAIAGLTFHF